MMIIMNEMSDAGRDKKGSESGERDGRLRESNE
jgi:hypothetical protein